MDTMISNGTVWWQWYDDLWERRDKRMDGLPLLSSPVYTALICLTYVYLVTIAGPNYMKDRKPMNIKSFLIIYNGFQVLLSAYIFVQVTKNNISLSPRSQTISNIFLFVNKQEVTKLMS